MTVFLVTVLAIAAGFPSVVLNDSEKLMEMRIHYQLDLGPDQIRATVIGKTPVKTFGTQAEVLAGMEDARCMAGINLIFDPAFETRYTVAFLHDVQSDSELTFIEIKRANKVLLRIRSTHCVGFNVRTLDKLNMALEAGKRGDLPHDSWTVELNGKVWEYEYVDFLSGTILSDEELAKHQMLPAGEASRALERLSRFLSPDRSLPLLKVFICGKGMPAFVRRACGDDHPESPQWVKVEDTSSCDFDASFGFPCLPDVIDMSSLPETSERSPTDDKDAHLDTDCEGSTQEIKISDQRYPDSELVDIFFLMLGNRGVFASDISVGSCSDFLLFQVIANTLDEKLKALTVLAEVFTRVGSLGFELPRAAELELVTANGESLGGLRITAETAWQIFDGKIAAEKFYDDNVILPGANQEGE